MLDRLVIAGVSPPISNQMVIVSQQWYAGALVSYSCNMSLLLCPSSSSTWLPHPPYTYDIPSFEAFYYLGEGGSWISLDSCTSQLLEHVLELEITLSWNNFAACQSVDLHTLLSLLDPGKGQFTQITLPTRGSRSLASYQCSQHPKCSSFLWVKTLHLKRTHELELSSNERQDTMWISWFIQ